MGDAQIVGPIKRAQLLDQAALPAIGGRVFVVDLSVEEVRQSICHGLNKVGALEASCGARRQVASQLKGAGLAGQRGAAVIRVESRVVDRVGNAALGVGDQRLCLFLPVRWQGQRRIRLAASVADGGFFQHVAESVHLQRQGVADAGIVRVALVAGADGFAGVSEEDRMAISVLWLQLLDREVLLGDSVGNRGFVGAIQRVDFLAQHGALERAAGFAFFRQRQTGGHNCVGQQALSGLDVAQPWLTVGTRLGRWHRATRRRSRRRAAGPSRHRCGTRFG